MRSPARPAGGPGAAGPLRILVVSPFLPFPPSWGGSTRVFHLARQLASHHEVTLLSYARHNQADAVRRLAEHFEVRVVGREAPDRAQRRRTQLRSLVSPVPFQRQEMHSGSMQAALDDLLGRTSFDVVQVEFSQMSGFRFATDAAVVVDEHNIEYELLRRMQEGERSAGRRVFNGVEYLKVRRDEERLWRRVDGCLLTSEREAAIVGRRAPSTPTAVVPNAVDLDYFSPAAEAVEPDSIIFTGLLSYRPNLDAARHLSEDIFPLIRRERPGATLKIVGWGHDADLQALRGPGIEVTGKVPDIRPYMARAAVTVAPIRMGSGTRLKVVEALAMGKALVSTTVGCEGIDVTDGRHLLVADDAESFAEATVRLLADRDLAHSLGQAGRHQVAAGYSWQRSAATLESFYGRLLAADAPAA